MGLQTQECFRVCCLWGIYPRSSTVSHHLEDHVKEKSISRLLSNNAGLPKIMKEI